MTEARKSTIRTIAACLSVVIQILGMLILIHYRPR